MRSSTRQLATLLGTAVLVPVAIALLQFVRDKPRVTEVPPPVRVVACPQVRISSGDLTPEDRGWIAAGAAALACERIRLRLGGTPERALPPGALVPLGSRVRSFDARDAAAVQRAAANAHADAIVEGELDVGKDFQITLRLVDRLGNELGKGNGAHVSLVGAVRMAEDMMSGEAGLSAGPGDRSLATTFPNASLDAILATHDLAVQAYVEDAEELGDACDVCSARSDLGSLAPLVTQVCSPEMGSRGGFPSPSVERKFRSLFFADHARGELLWVPWQNLSFFRRAAPTFDAGEE